MTTEESKPQAADLYQHVDGGFYRAMLCGTHTDNLEEQVVYSHVWPFEQKVWIRPLKEWTPDRFTKVSLNALVDAKAKYSQEHMQDIIMSNKAARRAKKGLA